MKKNRMTIEELEKLQKEGNLPIDVACDDGEYSLSGREYIKIRIFGVAMTTQGIQAIILDNCERPDLMKRVRLRHYPSLIQPKIERFYGHIGNTSFHSYTHFFDGDNVAQGQSPRRTKYKDGRWIDIDMDTKEITSTSWEL